jgi:hypothetical protein
MPQRIQIRRTKGWRMPEGAANVSRPTVWGNLFRVGSTNWRPAVDHIETGRWDRTNLAPMTLADVIEAHRRMVLRDMQDADYAASLRFALAGKDLACWCPLDQPCHADVLLEIANA